MATTAVRNSLYAVLLGLFAVAFALLLLNSFDAAIALFIVGYLVAILILSPFAGLIACLIFLYVRPFDYTPGLVETRSFLLMISATFAVTVFRHAAGDRTIRLQFNAQHIVLGWFVLAIAASHLAHLDLANAADATYTFLKTVILYLLITSLVTTYQRLRTFVFCLVLSTLVLACMGLLQKLTGVGATGLVAEKGRITAIGAAEDPNMYAQMLLVAVPFLYFFARSKANVVARLVSLSLIVFLGYLIYQTNSRGGFLSLAVLVGALVTRSYGFRVGIPTIAVALAAAFLFGPSRMEQLAVKEAPRIPLWEQGMSFFQSYPVFGIGKDAWTHKYHMMYAHNSFIQCAAEMGLFGLIPWVLLIYVAMRNLAFVARDRAAAAYENLGVYSEAVLFALMGFLLTSIFLSRTYSWPLFLLLATATATTNIFVGERRDEYAVLERKDVVAAVLFSVVGLGVFRVFLRVAAGF